MRDRTSNVDIVKHTDTRNQTLSYKVDVSTKFRREYNKWLIGCFGVTREWSRKEIYDIPITRNPHDGMEEVVWQDGRVIRFGDHLSESIDAKDFVFYEERLAE